MDDRNTDMLITVCAKGMCRAWQCSECEDYFGMKHACNLVDGKEVHSFLKNAFEKMYKEHSIEKFTEDEFLDLFQ